MILPPRLTHITVQQIDEFLAIAPEETTLKLRARAGTDVGNCIKAALAYSMHKQQAVEFTFNDTLVRVNAADMEAEYIHRVYAKFWQDRGEPIGGRG